MSQDLAPLPPPPAGKAPPATRLAGSTPAATAAELDSLVHAIEGRLTGGTSLAAQWLSALDWGVHFANAPFRRMELMSEAAAQWARLGNVIDGETVIEPSPADHRFSSPAWQQPPFKLMSQAFLLAEEWWLRVAEAPPGVDHANQRMVTFQTRQFVDMFSPSNIPWLNPEVIAATVASGGTNFLKGAENLRLDANAALTGHRDGEDTFVVGRDLAVTPGKVVFRNELIELLQYAPTTPSVAREPVLIVPAWIMKYYILDLSPHNSLIRYLVGQGHTVFCISWRNPDASLRETGFDDYRSRGVMAALDAVTDICHGARVHATGYCLGGTLLAIAAAAMARDGDQRLASVTMFCAQTDFTEAGELQLFVTEDQLAFLEDVMRDQGYLDSRQMAGSFQMLRSNDLFWSRLIKSYCLGEQEHPNDLMAWNADGTRMPARMHSEYLRRLFLNNDLAEGRFPAAGRPVALGDIRVPLFVVGTETDHVAPWHSVFKLHLLNESDLTFVLTSGGHNAGVVSPPGIKNRHYRIRERGPLGLYVGPDDWLEQAELRDGSWWPAWTAWLDARSGERVAPPAMGSEGYPPIDEAPGRYVLER